MPLGTSRLNQDGAVVTQSAVQDLTVAQLFTGVPETMEFESWWLENGKKRYMLLLYHTDKEVFEIMVDDSNMPLKVAVFDRKGRPLKAWDLHVGAVVDILGKPTTLMKARQTTMNWVDSEARRLWAKKLQLEAVLEKFCQVPDLTTLSGVTVRKLATTTHGSLGGTVNLGKLALTVVYLQNELKLYKDI